MNDDIYTYRDIKKKDLLDKQKKYCAYQERCHKDVVEKLKKLEADDEILDEIISELITENYLNEERFASSYVRGKHKINKWGRNKIKQQLKHKDISSYLIDKSLKEIIETEYSLTLRKLLEDKNKTITAKSPFERKKKLFSFAYRKGYENELINEIIEDILN